jgi:hypothetical protein
VTNQLQKAKSFNANGAPSNTWSKIIPSQRNVIIIGESYSHIKSMVTSPPIIYSRHPLTLFEGERLRSYSCCSKPAEEAGCTRGPHVFYESKAEDLHSRHAFSFTRPSVAQMDKDSTDTALDVVSIDCEMVYTTGGMRVARVSVVDGSGKQVFDELVRMDDGVEVM